MAQDEAIKKKHASTVGSTVQIGEGEFSFADMMAQDKIMGEKASNAKEMKVLPPLDNKKWIRKYIVLVLVLVPSTYLARSCSSSSSSSGGGTCSRVVVD